VGATSRLNLTQIETLLTQAQAWAHNWSSNAPSA
jgi:hypothetical protein